MGRFLSNWLTRSQNRNGGGAGNGGRADPDDLDRLHAQFKGEL